MAVLNPHMVTAKGTLGSRAQVGIEEDPGHLLKAQVPELLAMEEAAAPRKDHGVKPAIVGHKRVLQVRAMLALGALQTALKVQEVTLDGTPLLAAKRVGKEVQFSWTSYLEVVEKVEVVQEGPLEGHITMGQTVAKSGRLQLANRTLGALGQLHLMDLATKEVTRLQTPTKTPSPLVLIPHSNQAQDLTTLSHLIAQDLDLMAPSHLKIQVLETTYLDLLRVLKVPSVVQDLLTIQDPTVVQDLLTTQGHTVVQDLLTTQGHTVVQDLLTAQSHTVVWVLDLLVPKMANTHSTQGQDSKALEMEDHKQASILEANANLSHLQSVEVCLFRNVQVAHSLLASQSPNKYQGNNVKMYPDKIAAPPPDSNAELFLNSNAKLSQDNHAEKCPDKIASRPPGRNVQWSLVKLAPQSLSSSVGKFPSRNAQVDNRSNARLFLGNSAQKTPKKSVKMYQSRNAQVDNRSNARLFLGNSAQKTPKKSVKMYQSRNAQMCHDRNVKMFQERFQSNNAKMYRGKSASL